MCYGLTGAKYIIVAPDNFVQSLQPLADWKTKKGIKTKIVPLSVTGNSASQIKSYISTAYNTWDIRPQYVLLAGLSSVVPASGNSDDYYADMTGNYLIELSVGRFPCSSVAQCQNIVAKILSYERSPYMTDSLWYIKGTTIVREDGSPSSDPIYWENARYIHSCWRDYGYALIDSFSYQRGHTSTNVMNAINNGRMFVIYRGQGVGNWWSPFQITPNNTSNGKKLPIVVSGTCATMSLSDNTYLGNSFINAGSASNLKGSVGFYGTTGVGSGIAGQRGAATKGFFQAIFRERTFCMGDAAKRGKFLVDSVFHDLSRYQEWNLLGDPEMNIWTGIPERLTVLHDSVVRTIPQTFNVTVNTGTQPYSGATVCIMMDTLIYQVTTSNISGIASFNIFPHITGTMSVTVTAHNCIPYENNVMVRPGNLEHDVGVLAIIEPVGTITTGAIIIPRVRIKNNGIFVDTFPVTFKIGTIYEQSVSLVILNPGDSTIVSFPNWTAVMGSYSILTYTALNNDEWHGNDTAYGLIEVVPPNDVGVDAILSPTGYHQANTPMIPSARVKNYGTAVQTNFPIVCSIVGPGGIVRYINTQTVASLIPGAITTVNFSTWTPTITELCTVKMRTNLIGDENPSNDRKTQVTYIQNVYNQGFETNNGNFVPEPFTGGWAWGIPTSGPGSAHSGTKLWATVLGGQYANSVNWILTSPQYIVTVNNPTLRFWHWYQIESYYDGGNIKISTDDGATWMILTPTGGYPEDAAYTGNAGIPGEPCYSGTTTGNSWNEATFNLALNSGQAFYLRWHFGSDASVVYAGWYIDDVSGNGFLPLMSSVEEVYAPINHISTTLFVPKPNPFKTLTAIRYSLFAVTKVRLSIYDISGRLVKTLINQHQTSGIYSVNWDGKDDTNRSVAEGIYFCTLETDKVNYTKKLVFTR